MSRSCKPPETPLTPVAGEFQGRARKADRLKAPEPSQRGPQSINALVQYAEDPKTCRHVSICRYFGEKVDRSDAERLCQRFCDVCKDPKRTLTRFARLSSDHAISSQTQKLYTQIDAEEVPEPDQGEDRTLAGPVEEEEGDVDPGSDRAPSPATSEEVDSALALAARAPLQPLPGDSLDSDSDGDVPMRDLPPKPLPGPSAKSLGKRKAVDKSVFPAEGGDDDDLPDAWEGARPAAKSVVPRAPGGPAARPARDLDIFKKPAIPNRYKGPALAATATRVALQPQGSSDSSRREASLTKARWQV